jgi:hypothetical protein
LGPPVAGHGGGVQGSDKRVRSVLCRGRRQGIGRVARGCLWVVCIGWLCCTWRHALSAFTTACMDSNHRPTFSVQYSTVVPLPSCCSCTLPGAGEQSSELLPR